MKYYSITAECTGGKHVRLDITACTTYGAVVKASECLTHENVYKLTVEETPEALHDKGY